MSNKIRNILTEHEVPPPAGTWKAIAEELDQLESYSPITSKLKDLAVSPPARNWNNILSGLEEASLAEKLLGAAVTPPKSAWEKIQQGLTDEKVISLPQHKRPWIRYAVAAAMIGLITWGASYLISSAPGGQDLAVQPGKPVNSNNTTTPPSASALKELVTSTPAVNASDEARNDAALEASKKTYAKVDFPARHMNREVSNFYFSPAATIGNARGMDTDPVVQDIPSTAGRYITLLTPDGNIIRVSKKLGSMVCCISGEAEDPECQDQLKKWREKIVSSSLGHSADNFMDLLQLINSTGEEQEKL